MKKKARKKYKKYQKQNREALKEYWDEICGLEGFPNKHRKGYMYSEKQEQKIDEITHLLIGMRVDVLVMAIIDLAKKDYSSWGYTDTLSAIEYTVKEHLFWARRNELDSRSYKHIVSDGKKEMKKQIFDQYREKHQKS